MDLRFLQSLISVVELGSIAAAAKHEGITASAISQRLQALEVQLGVALLTRSGRNVCPTPTCTAMLPQIKKLLFEGQQLAQAVFQTTQVGRFVLGAVSTVLTDHVPAIVSRCAARFPDMDLQIHPGTSTQLYHGFTKGELDAVLCVEPPFALPKSQHFQVLEEQPVGLIQRAGDACPDKPFIVYDRSAWGGAACWRDVQQLSSNPIILCELDALETIAIMVREGLGVAVVPLWAGLSARFSDLTFTPQNERRRIGMLTRSHEVDHPVLPYIKAGFSG